MRGKIELSIVLPSFEEEENLRILLPKIREVITKIGCNFEILVVDTMLPMDKTKNVCKKNKAVYLNRKITNSFGNAVRMGINSASGKYIIFMDADGSHSPQTISRLYSERDSYDVVIASRYVKKGSTENNFFLVLMSRIVNFTYSAVLRLPCKDVSNSFKLYNSNHLKKLTLRCENFDIVEEMLFKLIKENEKLKVKEIPFTFKQRLYGKTKRNLFVFIATYIFTIIKLRLST